MVCFDETGMCTRWVMTTRFTVRAGWGAVLDLERGLDLDDLRHRVGRYATATDYDGSLRIFKRRIGAAFDLGKPDHPSELLD